MYVYIYIHMTSNNCLSLIRISLSTFDSNLHIHLSTSSFKNGGFHFNGGYPNSIDALLNSMENPQGLWMMTGLYPYDFGKPPIGARLDGGGLPTARSVAARICLVSPSCFSLPEDVNKMWIPDANHGAGIFTYIETPIITQLRFLEAKMQGLGLMSLFGDLFHISFKYLLESISPIVGWCETLGYLPTPVFDQKNR